MSATFATLADAIAAYEAAPDYNAECDILHSALPMIETASDATAAIDAFGDRAVGSHAADYPDESAYNEPWGAGIVSMHLTDGNAILAEWDSQGFWSVDVVPADKADAAVAEYAAELESDEEEEEEEEGDEESPTDD